MQKPINLGLSVVRLPCPCDLVIAVGFVVDSTGEVWVMAVPLEALLDEVSDPPCSLV